MKEELAVRGECELAAVITYNAVPGSPKVEHPLGGPFARNDPVATVLRGETESIDLPLPLLRTERDETRRRLHRPFARTNKTPQEVITEGPIVDIRYAEPGQKPGPHDPQQNLAMPVESDWIEGVFAPP
ncbi:hypothetical protein [Streptomyces sp. NPDC052496]|uniref:hypothetical protein n=1 Tax=Streptomyces sp. NPDC052496 TaxID=3154951 RepID=UPI00342A60FF